MNKEKESAGRHIAPMDDEIDRAIVEDELNLIIRRDVTGKVTFVNRAFCSFIGKDAYDLVGKTFYLPVVGEDEENFNAMRGFLSARNPVVSRQFRITGADGDVRWLKWTDRGIFGENGEKAAVQSVAQDMTAVMLADDMRRKYEAIVNTSREFMTFINRDFRYEAVNDAYCKAHGRKREDILGRTVTEVWGDEVFREKLQRLFDECFRGNEAHYEAEFVFGTLGLRHMRIGFYPYKNAAGETTNAIVITHDISEKINAERKLKLSYEELEGRIEERTAALSETNTILFKEISLREDVEKELLDARAVQERYIADQKELIGRLEEALEEVKTLSGILPICSHCKKIRDDEGYWKRVEDYITTHSGAKFSHGVCPDCLIKFYPDLAERIMKDMDR